MEQIVDNLNAKRDSAIELLGRLSSQIEQGEKQLMGMKQEAIKFQIEVAGYNKAIEAVRESFHPEQVLPDIDGVDTIREKANAR